MKLYNIIYKNYSSICLATDEQSAGEMFVAELAKVITMDEFVKVQSKEIDFDDYFNLVMTGLLDELDPIQAHVSALGHIGFILTSNPSVISIYDSNEGGEYHI